MYYVYNIILGFGIYSGKVNFRSVANTEIIDVLLKNILIFFTSTVPVRKLKIVNYIKSLNILVYFSTVT